MQGNCSEPPKYGPPIFLTELRPGQCALTVTKALFHWESNARPLVWLHGLYIYSPAFRNASLVAWNPDTSGKLYLSQITFHGGLSGLRTQKQAYLSGVQLQCMPSAPGLCFWINCS
jgi:hypothetical protein